MPGVASAPATCADAEPSGRLMSMLFNPVAASVSRRHHLGVHVAFWLVAVDTFTVWPVLRLRSWTGFPRPPGLTAHGHCERPNTPVRRRTWTFSSLTAARPTERTSVMPSPAWAVQYTRPA